MHNLKQLLVAAVIFMATIGMFLWMADTVDKFKDNIQMATLFYVIWLYIKMVWPMKKNIFSITTELNGIPNSFAEELEKALKGKDINEENPDV
jgi:hypothetical protein